MLNNGLSQSNRLMIEQPQLTDAYMKRIVNQRRKNGERIYEIWLKEGRKMRLLYKKVGGMIESFLLLAKNR
jgi:hypothetical protein